MSLDAWGSVATLHSSLRSLRLGSHGRAARSYPDMMAEIATGALRPELLVRDVIGLDEVSVRLAGLGEPRAGAGGVTVVRPGQALEVDSLQVRRLPS